MLLPLILVCAQQAPALHWDAAADHRYWQAIHWLEVEQQADRAADELLLLAADQSVVRQPGMAAYLRAQAWRALSEAGRWSEAEQLLPGIRRDALGSEFEEAVLALLSTNPQSPRPDLDPEFLDFVSRTLRGTVKGVDLALYGHKVVPYVLAFLKQAIPFEDSGRAHSIALELVRRFANRVEFQTLLDLIQTRDLDWAESISLSSYRGIPESGPGLQANQWFLVQLSLDPRLNIARAALPGLVHLAKDSDGQAQHRLAEILADADDVLAVEIAQVLRSLSADDAVLREDLLVRAATSPQVGVAQVSRSLMARYGMFRPLREFIEGGSTIDRMRALLAMVPAGGRSYSSSFASPGVKQLGCILEAVPYPPPLALGLQSGLGGAIRSDPELSFQDLRPWLNDSDSWFQAVAWVGALRLPAWQEIHAELSAGRLTSPECLALILPQEIPPIAFEWLAPLVQAGGRYAADAAYRLSNKESLTWPQLREIGRYHNIDDLVRRQESSWPTDERGWRWRREALDWPDLSPSTRGALYLSCLDRQPLSVAELLAWRDRAEASDPARANDATRAVLSRIQRILRDPAAAPAEQVAGWQWVVTQRHSLPLRSAPLDADELPFADCWARARASFEQVALDLLAEPEQATWMLSHALPPLELWSVEMLDKALAAGLQLPADAEVGRVLATRHGSAAGRWFDAMPTSVAHAFLATLSISPHSPEAMRGNLLKVLSDPHLAAVATDLLAALPLSDPEVEAVLGAWRIEGLDERPRMITALTRIADDRCLQAALDALDDHDPQVARAAFAALDQRRRVQERRRMWQLWRKQEQVGGPIDALIDRLDDPDRRLRFAAIESLGTLGVREALPLLVELMASPDEELAATAERAVAQINATARDASAAEDGVTGSRSAADG